jgi:rod shape-determining protein MreC
MRSSGRRQRLTIVGLRAICVVLLALDAQGTTFGGARNSASRAFGPLERGANSVFDPVGNFFSGLPDVGSNKSKIDALKRQNDQLRSQLRESSVNNERSNALRRLGLFVDRTQFKVATATVLDFGPSLGFEWAVRVDVGTNAGVRNGMTVISANGLVGRIKQASADTSIVVLAIDPGSSVGVRVARTGELGLVTGAGLGQMHFTPLNPKSKVKAGDTLITGPYGASTYAAGVPLGKVTHVSHSAANASATVDPYVGYTSLDVLAVVLNAPKPSSRQLAAPSSAARPDATPSRKAGR